jgi:hypothetical protein
LRKDAAQDEHAGLRSEERQRDPNEPVFGPAARVGERCRQEIAADRNRLDALRQCREVFVGPRLDLECQLAASGEADP